MKDKHVRMINDAIGKEAFERLSKLPVEVLMELDRMLRHGRVGLHKDGFLGITVMSGPGIWSNEGFEV